MSNSSHSATETGTNRNPLVIIQSTMLKESGDTQSLKHPINSCPIHLLSGWLEQGVASKHEEAIQY